MWFYKTKEFSLGVLVALGVVFIAKEGGNLFPQKTYAAINQNTAQVVEKTKSTTKEVKNVIKKIPTQATQAIQKRSLAMQEEMAPAIVKTKRIIRRTQNQITFNKPKPNKISVVSE